MPRRARVLLLLPTLLLAACGSGTSTQPDAAPPTPSPPISSPPATATFTLTISLSCVSSANVQVIRTSDQTVVVQQVVNGTVTLVLPVGTYRVEGAAVGAYPAALGQTIQGSADQALDAALVYGGARDTTITPDVDGITVQIGAAASVPFTLNIGNPDTLTGQVTFSAEELPAGVTATAVTRTLNGPINTPVVGSLPLNVAAGVKPGVVTAVLRATNDAGMSVSTRFTLLVQPVTMRLETLSAAPDLAPAQQGLWVADFGSSSTSTPTNKLFQAHGTDVRFQLPNDVRLILFGTPSGNALVFESRKSSGIAQPIRLMRSDGSQTVFERTEPQYQYAY